MKRRIGAILKLVFGVGAVGATLGGAADAQQGSTFSSIAEAQAYLASNPRGPRAEEAFRFLLISNLGSVDPSFQSLSPTRSLDGVIDGGSVLSQEATDAARSQLAAGATAGAAGVARSSASATNDTNDKFDGRDDDDSGQSSAY